MISNCYRAIVILTPCICIKTNTDQWKRIKSPEINPWICSQLITREPRILNEEKVISSKNSVRKLDSHMQWVCGCESWTVKKAEHRKIDAFELWCWRRLESSLDSKEIQPVHPEGDQSWVFIGRTDAEGETTILWPPDAKSWFIGKDPDAGRDWGQEEKGTIEDEMAGWHHRLDEHESE